MQTERTQQLTGKEMEKKSSWEESPAAAVERSRDIRGTAGAAQATAPQRPAAMGRALIADGGGRYGWQLVLLVARAILNSWLLCSLAPDFFWRSCVALGALAVGPAK
ncbi:hypothetical protein ABZP36_023526 [Zizania latifolia]